MKNQQKNHYQILGVTKSATTNDIKIAYRQLIRQYHPDKGGCDSEQVQRINHAYETLRDPKKRLAYDKKLQTELFGERVWQFFDKAQNQFDKVQDTFRQNFRDNIEFLKNIATTTNEPFNDHIKVAVYPSQAIFGDKVIIQTNFHHLLVPMPAFEQTLTLTIKGAGKPKNDGTFGNLVVEFFIKVPPIHKLTDEQKQLWKQLKLLQNNDIEQ